MHAVGFDVGAEAEAQLKCIEEKTEVMRPGKADVPRLEDAFEAIQSRICLSQLVINIRLHDPGPRRER